MNAELTLVCTSDVLRMAQIRSGTMNPAHLASHFLGGNPDTLSDKPDSKLHDVLQHFYKRYYSDNFMAAIIYSNQPLPDMAKLSAYAFDHITNHRALVSPIIVLAAAALPIANNSAAFRSKIDTYINLIGNCSPGILADWLQKEELAASIDAGADPMVNRNGGVFAIAAFLSDKGYAQRDQVMATIFSYLSLLRHQGIQGHYFDEIAHVLGQDFCFRR
ncbi:insulinase family protein [Sodalis sp.]|uniref:insulinase family protein n=1 Tax=Sodalis sp. (in: enterobacteria) TaxID=1898979 RepID=UPI003872AE48